MQAIRESEVFVVYVILDEQSSDAEGNSVLSIRSIEHDAVRVQFFAILLEKNLCIGDWQGAYAAVHVVIPVRTLCRTASLLTPTSDTG